MRGCVLAGVWGAGKTSVYQRVIARLVEAGRQSLVTMPQAATITTHTYTPGEPREQADTIVSWLNALTGFLEEIDRRFHASTLPNHRFAPAWAPTCVLEGLGFDVPMYELPLPRSDLLGIEHRLAALGVHLVLLRVPEPHIRAQCVESTRHHRGEKWARYLNELGPTDTARTHRIRRVQDELTGWARTSPLPLRVLDTGTGDWDTCARHVTHLLT